MTDLDGKPYRPLDIPRSVDRDDLPPELIRFYERNEGIGLETAPDRSVRICRLDEVREFTWRDVPIFGTDAEPGWDAFRGYVIGVGEYLDWIYLVRDAPYCPSGAILTIGPGIAGPAGSADNEFYPSLVLASNFDEWLGQLSRYDWLEFGLAPGEIWDLDEPTRSEVLAHFRTLNPAIEWEEL